MNRSGVMEKSTLTDLSHESRQSLHPELVYLNSIRISRAARTPIAALGIIVDKVRLLCEIPQKQQTSLRRRSPLRALSDR